MTNEDIIFSERLRLMRENVIGTTGRKFVVEVNGTRKEIEEPEQIHTYAAWKQLGYQVNKGEKAITKLTIWKHVVKKSEDGDAKEKIFWKQASFFSARQVSEI